MHERVLWMMMLIAAVWKLCHMTRGTGRMPGTIGNIIDYPVEVSTPTSDLTNMKLHVNSAISDVKSRYMCMDVKDFYLNNKMDRA